MKPSWTVSKLIREYPQCRRVLDAYDLKVREVGSLSISALAEEIEEDLDDFMDEIDTAINSLSEYDADFAEADDDLDASDDDEYEDEDEDALDEDDEGDEDLEDHVEIESGLLDDDEEEEEEEEEEEDLDDF